MSNSEERRREQAEYWDAMERMAQERPIEQPAPFVEDRQSWASECAGVVHGTHERTKESRLAGIYKCKWCAQTFEPPTLAELDSQLRHAVSYRRPQRRSSRGW